MQNFVQRLGRDGFAIAPALMPLSLVATLREDLAQRRALGSFHQAGVGQGRALQSHPDIRRDEISWLERATAPPGLWSFLESLRAELNRQLFLGLEGFEGHYAIYPPGGFYQRHRDVFRADSDRVISLVLYLNSQWQEADGGRLRIYRNDGGTLDVDPTAGTLVCFLSRETEHEVLSSARERLSFTGWFKVRTLTGPARPSEF